MGKLTCKCLNVHISTKSSESSAYQPSSPGQCSDEFFSFRISEVQLSLEGVKFEHPYLVKTREVDDWVIHKCLICEEYTHATHAVKGSGKVLISHDLVSERIVLEKLLQSVDYSPLYRVLLPSRNDNQPIRSLGVQSGRYETLQKLLGDIQQQLNNFLVREEDTMENRIRTYMESQRSAYAELQSKVRRDKNAMVNLILASVHQDIAENLSDAMTESPTSPHSPSHESPTSPHSPSHESPTSPLSPSRESPTSPHSPSHESPTSPLSPSHESLSHVPSSEDRSGSEPDSPEQSSTATMTKSKRPSAFMQGQDDVPTNKTQKLPSLAERLKGSSRLSATLQEQEVPSSVDPDGDLDFASAFQDENNQPFFISDDETEDTDDSEPEWRNVQVNKQSLYSTSVPITVPMWGGRHIKKSYTEEEDEDGILPQDAASMAASIKALAQSVHGDGTEIFGELPRARRNTSNFPSCFPE